MKSLLRHNVTHIHTLVQAGAHGNFYLLQFFALESNKSSNKNTENSRERLTLNFGIGIDILHSSSSNKNKKVAIEMCELWMKECDNSNGNANKQRWSHVSETKRNDHDRVIDFILSFVQQHQQA